MTCVLVVVLTTASMNLSPGIIPNDFCSMFQCLRSQTLAEQRPKTVLGVEGLNFLARLPDEEHPPCPAVSRQKASGEMISARLPAAGRQAVTPPRGLWAPREPPRGADGPPVMDLTEEGVGKIDGFSQWECVKSMGFS